MDTGVPVIFCVLTCDTQEQAIARSGGKDGGNQGNKGFDGGLAAVEMANVSRELDAPKKNKLHRELKARTAPRRERRTR